MCDGRDKERREREKRNMEIKGRRGRGERRHEKVYMDTSVRGQTGQKKKLKNNRQRVLIEECEERERIKGVRGQQREEGEGVIDENPDLQAPWWRAGQLTSSHHTHTQCRTPETNPLTSFDPTHTSKICQRQRRPCRSIHSLTPTSTALNPSHVLTYITSNSGRNSSRGIVKKLYSQCVGIIQHYNSPIMEL